MNTVLFDQRVNRRWQDRGGTNLPKRSGRFTKPGPRPRAASLAEARKRREALVDKVSQVMPQIYNADFPGLTVSNGLAYLDNSTPQTGAFLGTVRLDPFRTNPYGVYDSGTTSGISAADNSATYTWGIDYASNPVLTTGTTAASTITISPTIHPITIDTGSTVRAFDAMGQAARQAGEAIYDWATNIHIHVDPSIPEGHIYMVPPDPEQNGWVERNPFTWTPFDPRQRLRQQMEPQRPPCRADGVSFQNCSPAELTALTLLKKMVDEEGWRTYLKYGFVNIRGKSGLDYQIRRGQWHVLVRRSGKMVAELCVGLSQRSQMPPTDEVIARMIMAECDEPELWRRANVDIKAESRRYHSNPQNHEHLERVALAS